MLRLLLLLKVVVLLTAMTVTAMVEVVLLILSDVSWVAAAQEDLALQYHPVESFRSRVSMGLLLLHVPLPRTLFRLRPSAAQARYLCAGMHRAAAAAADAARVLDACGSLACL